MRRIVLLLVLCIIVAQSESFSQPASRRPLTVDDLMQLKSVADPQVSPDGRWVAYAVTSMDLKKDKNETRIWMVGSSGGEAIPMTAPGHSCSRPRWSPDNKYLSFLAPDENEESQVWTLNRLGGEAEQITHIKQGVGGYEWSPDGRQLLLLIRDPRPEELTEDKEDDKKEKPYVIDRLQFKRDYEGYLDHYRTHIYKYTPGDTVATQLTSGDYDDSHPVWKPDGTSIAFVSNRSANPDGNENTDIWIVSADNTDQGKTLLQVTKNENADSEPAWSPDGKSIVFTTITDKASLWYATNKLAVVSSTGGTPKILTEKLDRNVYHPRVSPDGKSIYFILEEHGTSIVASTNMEGSNLKRVVQGEAVVDNYALNTSAIYPLMSVHGKPFDIYAFQNSQLKKLTAVNEDLFKALLQPEMEKIHFKSKDGTDIEGFVVKPVEFKPGTKYPTILWIHGGPVSQFDWSFDERAQLFAAHGYVTLMINPRGSSGYGQDFSKAIFADWGNKDFEDVMAGVDYGIEAGLVDPGRLGVGGWSYGGILTNNVITKTSRFKAAISGASEALYRSNYGHDQYQYIWEKELGLPWENAALWEKMSPFNNVDKITTPTLWMGGSADWNVPILNSEQMYQAMKRLGKDTELVVYPGEHHGFSKPSFIKDRYERFVAWYDKYLK